MADELDLGFDPDVDTDEEEVDDGSSEYDSTESDQEDLADDPEELERGYLRQADYTRKTQRLAEERQQVAAERAQLLQMQQFLVAQAQQQQPPQEEEYFDPLERELLQTKALTLQVAQTMQAQMFQSQADMLAAYVQQESKVPITGEEILQFATQRGGLPLDVAAETLAARKEREARTAQTAAVRASKKGAPPVESGGSRSAPKSSSKSSFEADALKNFERFMGKG